MRSCRLAQSFALIAVGFLVFPAAGRAQITLGQTDNFSTGLQNWTQGAQAPPGALSVVNGGPSGAADPFMQIMANGSTSAGGRMTVFNQSQWTGNYNAAGVGSVEMDLKSLSGPALSVRIVVRDVSNDGYTSTVGFPLPADGQWHHAVFRLDDASMTAIGVPPTLSQVLSGPRELRIIHSAGPAINGDMIAATLGVDNIRASPVPEPTGILILAAGAGCGGLWIRRRLR
ncbi:MAG TPA: PEP-CTERM sorting domain-containing protein [Gemmataceae bacterium]|jgi:hypothetical protein|nr:PEP-CTERM sorting domain-containing protein [Gemmataceae bacterium]